MDAWFDFRQNKNMHICILPLASAIHFINKDYLDLCINTVSLRSIQTLVLSKMTSPNHYKMKHTEDLLINHCYILYSINIELIEKLCECLYLQSFIGQDKAWHVNNYSSGVHEKSYQFKQPCARQSWYSIHSVDSFAILVTLVTNI